MFQTLEGQLRDVAYGTKQFKLKNQLKLSVRKTKCIVCF